MSATPQPIIAVRIKLDDRDPVGLKVHLGFRNDSPALALLWDKLAAPEGKLDSNRFEILADGQRVAYTGVYVKRSAPSLEEFLTLAPGQVVLATVNLDKYYALPREMRITVTYNAFNPSVGSQKLLPLRSNTAVVDLR